MRKMTALSNSWTTCNRRPGDQVIWPIRAHLDHKHEAEGQRDQDQEYTHQGQQPGAGHGAAASHS